MEEANSVEYLRFSTLFDENCRHCLLLTGDLCFHLGQRQRFIRHALSTDAENSRTVLFFLLDRRFRTVYDHRCDECRLYTYEDRNCDHSTYFFRVMCYLRRRSASYLFKELNEELLEELRAASSARIDPSRLAGEESDRSDDYDSDNDSTVTSEEDEESELDVDEVEEHRFLEQARREAAERR